MLLRPVVQQICFYLFCRIRIRAIRFQCVIQMRTFPSFRRCCRWYLNPPALPWSAVLMDNSALSITSGSASMFTMTILLLCRILNLGQGP